MEPRYHIAGTEQFGYSIFNRYLHSLLIYKNTVKRICKLYNYAPANFLKGYVAHYSYIRLKSFDTLYKVVVEHKDFVTANCIIRMLGDTVAVFHLIYMEPDVNFRLLRHCLYVLDGCECNLRVLPGYTIQEGGLPENELIEANKQIQFNIEHRKRMMQQVQEMLDASPLKQVDEEAFNRIVKDRNWKFKEFSNKSKKNNQYQWRELYKRIDYCKGCDILSFMSQYAHGLSMSNLILEFDEQNCNGILGEALGLLDRMNVYVLNFFTEEYLYIIEGLKEPKMRDQILACYDDEHRPSIEEWEKKFTIK